MFNIDEIDYSTAFAVKNTIWYLYLLIIWAEPRK